MGKNTQFNHFMRVRNALTEEYNSVIRNKKDFKEYLKVRQRVWNHPSYDKLTKLNKEFISGMDSAYFNIIQVHFTEWRLYNAAGELVISHYSNDPKECFDYSVCRAREAKGLIIGEHTWKGTTILWSSKS